MIFFFVINSVTRLVHSFLGVYKGTKKSAKEYSFFFLLGDHCFICS